MQGAGCRAQVCRVDRPPTTCCSVLSVDVCFGAVGTPEDVDSRHVHGGEYRGTSLMREHLLAGVRMHGGAAPEPRGVPRYCETVAKRLKGGDHVGPLSINGFIIRGSQVYACTVGLRPRRPSSMRSSA